MPDPFDLDMPIPEGPATPIGEKPRDEGMGVVVPETGHGWCLVVGGQRVPLSGTRLVIGREDADVIVAGQGVSRRHAELIATPEGWFVRDLGSTNGTRLDGRRLEPGEAAAIQGPARLVFGSQVALIER